MIKLAAKINCLKWMFAKMFGNYLPNAIMHLMRQIIPLDCNIQLTNNSTTSFEMNPHASTILLLIIQEALANCAMHSKANTVTCNINCVDIGLVIRIIDNGIGLAPGFKKKEGMANMEANASKINGKINIYNRSDLHDINLEGTEVVISLAKKNPEPEASLHTT